MSASGDTLPAFEDRILAALIESGTLNRDAAERARRAHGRAGGSIADVLVRLGLCEEKVLALQIAADVLQIPIDNIDVIQGDTRQVQAGHGTFNSRSMAVGGSSLHVCSQRIVEKAKNRFSEYG